MHNPGDVVHFWSIEANKPKYHLCVSLGGHYLLLNSPNSIIYEGNLALPCSDFPFLAPTPTGETVICCTLVLAPSARTLAKVKPVVKGTVSRAVLLKIVSFVEDCDALSEDDREAILAGLDGWL